MVTKTSDIVKDVKICIDEIADNDAEFEGTQDDEELAKIIKSKVPDALRFVYANADWSMLDPSVVLTTATVSEGDIKCGTVSFGDNKFLRLVYAKYPSWKRYLGHDDIIMWDDKEYAMLHDAYCTGTNERPKIALAWGGTNGKEKVLELYCAPNGESPRVGIMTEPEEENVYSSTIPDDADDESEDTTPVYSSEKGYDIPYKVYRAVIYYISGLVFVTYADQQKAQMMFSEASDLIGFVGKSDNNIT